MAIMSDLTEKDIKVWLSTITREQIIIDRHALKRSRLRGLSEEIVRDFLIERRYEKIERKVTDDNLTFEISYSNPDKSMKTTIVIIVMPVDIPKKIIKVVTIIND
jgi:adenine-specific DNA methylase